MLHSCEIHPLLEVPITTTHHSPLHTQYMSHQTTRKQSSTMLDAERSDSRNMFLTRKQVVSVEESPPALGPCSDSSNGSNSEELEFDRESLPATISRMRVTPLPSRIPSDLSASSEGNSNVKNDLEVAMVVKNDAPSPKGKRKKVRFDTITIRCMRLIAGDHPSCMEGPSVSNIVGLVTSDCLLPF